PEIQVLKKNRPKTYNLADYIVEVQEGTSLSSSTSPLCRSREGGNPCPVTLSLGLLSRPEGSLRPEVILQAVAKPDLCLRIIAITRCALQHQEL
ncbi:MAG: hypothetical protein LBP91_02825, partial [Coriobacteriales bacterium]|nr:hypothetical protein [Coriobacteriales bacterium]